MYGDDVSCGHPSWELEKARASDLSDENLRKLLGENAKNLYELNY